MEKKDKWMKACVCVCGVCVCVCDRVNTQMPLKWIQEPTGLWKTESRTLHIFGTLHHYRWYAYLMTLHVQFTGNWWKTKWLTNKRAFQPLTVNVNEQCGGTQRPASRPDATFTYITFRNHPAQTANSYRAGSKMTQDTCKFVYHCQSWIAHWLEQLVCVQDKHGGMLILGLRLLAHQTHC